MQSSDTEPTGNDCSKHDIAIAKGDRIMKVLSYGSLNIDMVFKVPHIVREGETLSASSMTRNAGGKGGNQAAALAKAGLNVSHAGKIGRDGLFLIENLERYGIDTSLVTVTDRSSGQAIILLDQDSQNSIVLLAGENRNITKEEIDAVMSSYEEGDWIVLQNEINNIDYIIDNAYEKGMKICFNPAPFDESVLALPLDKVSLLIFNEIEGAGLAGTEIGTPIDKIIAKLEKSTYSEEMILTLGKEGAVYISKDKTIYQPIIPADVVDTTAAGDTFIGYFLASRIKGLSIEESLEKASYASSITVSREGAMETIPTAAEVFI